MTRQAKTTPLTQDQMLAIAKQYWDDQDIPGTWEKMQERLCSLPKDESDRLIKVIQREHWSRMKQRRPRSVAP